MFYLEALHAKAPYNETGWALTDPKQEALLDAAMAETDAAKAAEKWHAVQEQQVREGGYLIPANNNFLDAYNPRVHGGNTAKYGSNSDWDYHAMWLA